MHPTKDESPRAATPGDSELATHQEGSSTVILQTECKHCTVPVDQGDICAFCKTYTPPLTVNTLLSEADALLPTLLASRLASASACFPGPDGGTVYVQSSGNRVNIAVTEKDPDTKQLVTREFTAVITEVTR